MMVIILFAIYLARVDTIVFFNYGKVTDIKIDKEE